MVNALEQTVAETELTKLSGWKLTQDGKRIRKDWQVKNFLAGLDFFRRVGTLAEEMQHHPDLHIENYKDVWIEIWTHTVDGLTDNDFALARKIDELEV